MLKGKKTVLVLLVTSGIFENVNVIYTQWNLTLNFGISH